MRPASFGRDVNYVDLQSDYGAQLVAELFAKQGRRRVAMINGPAQHLDAIESHGPNEGPGWLEILSYSAASRVAVDPVDLP